MSNRPLERKRAIVLPILIEHLDADLREKSTYHCSSKAIKISDTGINRFFIAKHFRRIIFYKKGWKTPNAHETKYIHKDNLEMFNMSLRCIFGTEELSLNNLTEENVRFAANYFKLEL